MKFEDFLKKNENQGLYKEDLVAEIWQTELSVFEKINSSIQLNNPEPTYPILSRLWLEYSFSNSKIREYDEFIYSYYLSQLSDSNKSLEDSVEYSLYFNILEDPELNKEAWNYFLSQNPNERFIKILLANSGPVPYKLKHCLHKKLIGDKNYHRNIYLSIRHSCFDNCGKVDKALALETLNKLEINEHIKELDNQGGFRKYNEVVAYLNNEIEKFKTE